MCMSTGKKYYPKKKKKAKKNNNTNTNGNDPENIHQERQVTGLCYFVKKEEKERLEDPTPSELRGPGEAGVVTKAET